jgi:cation diffusion facilitator CzcD-associated flavoprotein CzcO
VIGAGAAGMATVRRLRADGFDFDCFEKTDRVGGHWHTDYACLHLITARDVSGFEGHPMPAAFPHFPSREQVVGYLEGYADRFGLRESITFGAEVVRASPLGAAGDDGWEVELAGGDTRRYDGVIVANGHLWDPLVPEYPGEFAGRAMHSVEYRDHGDAEGDSVLVVGAGNSGCDIAVELAHARKQTFVSMRKGRLFQPKTLFGRPRAVLRMARLPPRLNELATVGLMHVAHGPPSRYGMPSPRSWWLRDSPPVVNSQLLHWVHHGRVTIVPAISRLDGDSVVFADGSSRRVDTIVWATGFKVTFPFLDEALVQRRDGVPLRYAATTVPAGLERLYYVGLGAPRGAQLPTYDVGARLVARMLPIKERHDVSLSERFAGLEAPEWRIDMLRHEWQGQVARTEKVLAGMERA